MSYYLQILAVQTPFEIGEDDNERSQFSCNYDCERYDADTLLESDISIIVEDAGLATLSKIILGMRTALPMPTEAAASGTEPDGPFVRIISTGGYSSDINRSGVRAEKPSCQIIVSSLDTALANETAWAIYRLLDGMRQRKTG